METRHHVFTLFWLRQIDLPQLSLPDRKRNGPEGILLGKDSVSRVFNRREDAYQRIRCRPARESGAPAHGSDRKPA